MSLSNPFDDVDGERATAQERDRKLRERRREDEDMKWLMSSRQGRRIVRRILDQTAVPTGDPFNVNALVMARNVGIQETGRRLLALIESCCPEQRATMDREHHDDRDADRRTSNK